MKKISLLIVLTITPSLIWATNQDQILAALNKDIWGMLTLLIASIIITVSMTPLYIGDGSNYVSIFMLTAIVMMLLFHVWQLAVIDVMMIILILVVDFIVRRIRDWITDRIYKAKLLGWRSLWRKSRF